MGWGQDWNVPFQGHLPSQTGWHPLWKPYRLIGERTSPNPVQGWSTTRSEFYRKEKPRLGPSSRPVMMGAESEYHSLCLARTKCKHAKIVMLLCFLEKGTLWGPKISVLKASCDTVFTLNTWNTYIWKANDFAYLHLVLARLGLSNPSSGWFQHRPLWV